MSVLKKHIVLNSLLLTIVFVNFTNFSTAKGTEEFDKKLFEERKYHTREKELKAFGYDKITGQCKQGINPFKPIRDNVSENDETVGTDTLHLTKDTVLNVPLTTEKNLPITDSTSNILSEKTDTTTIKTETDTIGINNEAQENIETENISENPVKIPDGLADTTFNFILTTAIHYQVIGQFKTGKGKAAFIKGWESTKKLKQLLAKLEQLRSAYEQAPPESKQEIAKQVLNMEAETIQLKADADKNYLEARDAEMDYWNSAPLSAVRQLKTENDSIRKQTILQKTVKPAEMTTTNIDTVTVADSASTILRETTAEKPEIQIVYKIQIGAYSKGLPEYVARLYKKLAAFRRIDHHTDEDGVVVYTVGELTNFDDALKLEEQIKQEGVKDAFVVAYNNGKRITLEEAKETTKK